MPQGIDIQRLHTLSCPRGTTEKREARRNTGVAREAADSNLPPQGIPAMEGHQFVQ